MTENEIYTKHILGRMTSKESTKEVVKTIAIDFAVWKDNCTSIEDDGIYSNETDKLIAYNQSELFDYWINNVLSR